MKDIEDVCFVVQARLNSQRLPKKMIRPFAGSTLVDIVLSKLVSIESIPNDQIYFSGHEPSLIELAMMYPISIWPRSVTSANTDNGVQMIFDWWKFLQKEFKYVVLVSACNPLLKKETIERFVQEYLKSPHPGMFGVFEKKTYFWNTEGELITNWPEGQDLLNTKAVETVLEAGHCLYGSSIAEIGQGKWVGSWKKKNDPVLFTVPEIECFDIDYEWQFNVAEKLYQENGYT